MRWKYKHCKLEFKPQDCWIGVYWRVSHWEKMQGVHVLSDLDIWICILPMLPIHLFFLEDADGLS